MKIGDEIITKSSLWFQGEDLGNRLGKIIDTTSYVMVELYDYHSNPIKCTRNEVEVVDQNETAINKWLGEEVDDEYVNGLFSDLDMQD